MADTKISALTAATTPLAGTEVLPIVQSSTTKKVSIADVTAGRAISTAGVTDTSLTASKPVFTDASKKLTSSGTLATDQGGTGLTSYSQGDLVYYNTGTTLTALPKNTNATRYLANTGTSNNPAWAQVDLTNGVTGTLPVGNGGTGLSSLTANRVLYASATNTVGTSANLTFNGNDLTVNGIVAGRGTGNVAGNVVFGNSVFGSNTTGVGIVAVGQQAAAFNTTGDSQVAIGIQALYGGSALTGSQNTSVGANSGQNTRGAAGQNSYFGSRAGFSNQTGSANTYLGEASAYSMTGSNNSVLGRFSGNDGTTNLTTSSGVIVLSEGTGIARAYHDGTDWVFPTGNLKIGTSGKGIDFSATPGTGTSELFADYEEGTWTPVAADATSGGNTTTAGTGYYRKIGSVVIAWFRLTDINTTGLTAGNEFNVQGLPFSVGIIGDRAYGNIATASVTFGGYCVPEVNGGLTSFRVTSCQTGAAYTRLLVSAFTDDQADLNGVVIYIN